MKIAVLGAGIIGLSSAYKLKTLIPEVEIHVIAELFTPNTTSNVAAGYWIPPAVTPTENRDKVLKWSLETQDFASDILKRSENAAKMGISFIHGYLLSRRDRTPYWKDHALNYHLLQPKELNQFPTEIKWGMAFTSVVTEGNKMLPYLMNELTNYGVKFIQRKVDDLTELFQTYDVIINCTGIGAYEVAKDKCVYPVRGYVLRVKAPWIKEFIYDIDLDSQKRLRYILPNQESVILGGFKQDYNSDLNINEEEKKWLLNETKKFVPSLENVEIVEERIGFRPGRPCIRLEKEVVNGKYKTKCVIHNYGHSGNGWTLYWGCANEVSKILQEFIEVNDFRSHKSCKL